MALPAAAEERVQPVGTRIYAIEHFHPFSSRTRFGKLEFLGGLHVASDHSFFGGFSGLRLMGDRMIAVSDSGYWFDARLKRAGGRLAGLTGMRVTPMLDETGEPFLYKWQIDSEGLERRPSGGWLVSTERDNRVLAFDGDPFAGPVAGRIAYRLDVKELRRNRGLEAIALRPTRGGIGLVILSEDSRRLRGEIDGFALADDAPDARVQPIAVRKIGTFAVTDAAFLPDGDLLLLERRFDLASGPGMRIRRVAADDVRPGAVMDGEVLVEAGLPHQIDNMEGLAVSPHPQGHRLTLVSDDNRSLLQRTLILEFLLRD